MYPIMKTRKRTLRAALAIVLTSIFVTMFVLLGVKSRAFAAPQDYDVVPSTDSRIRKVAIEKVARLSVSVKENSLKLGDSLALNIRLSSISNQAVFIQRPAVGMTLGLELSDARGYPLKPMPSSGLVDWAIPEDLFYLLGKRSTLDFVIAIETRQSQAGQGGLWEVFGPIGGHDRAGRTLPQMPELVLGVPGPGTYHLAVSLGTIEYGHLPARGARTPSAFGTLHAAPLSVVILNDAAQQARATERAQRRLTESFTAVARAR